MTGLPLCSAYPEGDAMSALRIPAKSAGYSGRSRPPGLIEVGRLF
jgi:hypothetical protein